MYQNSLIHHQGLINLLREALNNMFENSLPTLILNFEILSEDEII